MKIKYIFFDFDGVLAESVNIKTEAFRQMYLSHGAEFAQKVVDYHIDNGGISRYEKFKIYNQQWLGEEATQGKIDELAETFSNLVMEGVINCPEVRGTSDFLKASEAYIKYIITGTPTIEIKPILEKRNMSHFFVEAYGAPEKKDFWVKEILKNENISAQQCVFIGDALTDYSAATNNDITFILRETDEAKHLFENFKGHRIKDLTNLQEVLDNIQK